MQQAELPNIAVLLDHLGLGRLRREAIVLKSGTFPVWKVQTSEGSFHVKAFGDGDWDWRSASLAGSSEVERAALAAGVETAEPVVLNARVENCRVTVHRWIEGRPLDHADDVHEWLGRTLATLHTLPPPLSSPADSLASYHGLHPADDWAAWADEAASKRLGWAPAAKRTLADITVANELVVEGITGEPVVGSHRDLLPQNILVDGSGRFLLIDWDLAGPAIPWLETVMAVMDIGRFAGGRAGSKSEFPDAAAAAGILRGYLQAGGREGRVDRAALASRFGMVLGRISFAMWVSLGHRISTDAERRTAGEYLDTALPRLRRRLDANPEVCDLLTRALANARGTEA